MRPYIRRFLNKVGKKDDFFFIQVGANDGVMCDPLRSFILKHNWSGILVEPVPDYFELLKKNYEGRDNLTFEQVAVSSEPSDSLKIYYLKRNAESEKELRDWEFGLSGFDMSKDDKWKSSKFAGECDVPITTVSELVNKHDVSHIDMLQIDAEGHDFEVIKGVDFSKVCPKIINYEHRNLGRDKHPCKNFLRERGYYLYIQGRQDTFAVHESLGVFPR